MLERLDEPQRIRRIQFDGLEDLPTKMPDPPLVPVTRSGFFGRPDSLATAHNQSLQETANQVTETGYVEIGMATLGAFAQEVIPTSIRQMERKEEEFAPGSLARQAAEKITELHAQMSLQAHTALQKAYVEGSIQRLKRYYRG